MKVAIVHEFMTKIGGAEKVLLELHKIYPDAPIYTLLYDHEGTKEVFSNCKIITSGLQKYPSWLRKKTKFFISKFASEIENFDLSEYDIVISSSNSFAHGIITKPNTFHLCYCYSPMRYVWDWHNEYLKENHIGFGPVGLVIRKILFGIRQWDKIASYRVDKWVAISNHVRKRIRKYYGFDSDIIFPPVNISDIKKSENLPDDYYVIVSRLEPYKKVDLAVKAFNASGRTLIIIGEGSDKQRLQSIAKKNIEFLGWQSDESVYEYLRNAKAFIFPGEEDFGITPVESMACGRPVIAFNKGGTTETVNKQTGVFFDKTTPESLNIAIDNLENNYLKFTPADCRAQAEKFSSERFREEFEKTVHNEYEKFICQKK